MPADDEAAYRFRAALPLLPPGARLLVAVSGGQDSLCLLKLLFDAAPIQKWSLHVGHLDHRWRPDSERTAQQVGRLCWSWGIPFHLAIAKEVPHSEAAARAWRYSWLEQVALGLGLERVLTAHTLSDRAETLLFNLLRGSGGTGLASLDWQRPLGRLQLIRPLLDISRAQTAAFCEKHDLPVCIDASNFDLTYRRNRIRLELLPYLREHFNPQIEAALVQTAEVLRAESDCLEALAAPLYASLIDNQQLNRRQLALLPLALQRRVARHWLATVLQRAPNFDQTRAVLACLSAVNHTRTAPLAQGLLIEVRGEWLALVPS
ncbi:tRNA lysidine(34) synthetase TilS [Gloeobacter kilaueensis]|uniref:tRNA(Ile)-lysidine synthase n=1 Tax=Gloeobacter kilaueensis (strain ATCC BAA-2537 / CCAP 1431/1 / ULC 316 / JS1) TaxID=1183438 RepID=U5QIJ7_GLOK1|nr:tRNA lysidine(34) synthetase TilS [Gloeobacter kilaueensis]AGY58713.1 tRNA(Ile)-lysidine synthetase [Gloeobacter kilaueensis JS1]